MLCCEQTVQKQCFHTVSSCSLLFLKLGYRFASHTTKLRAWMCYSDACDKRYSISITKLRLVMGFLLRCISKCGVTVTQILAHCTFAQLSWWQQQFYYCNIYSKMYPVRTVRLWMAIWHVRVTMEGPCPVNYFVSVFVILCAFYLMWVFFFSSLLSSYVWWSRNILKILVLRNPGSYFNTSHFYRRLWELYSTCWNIFICMVLCCFPGF